MLSDLMKKKNNKIGFYYFVCWGRLFKKKFNIRLKLLFLKPSAHVCTLRNGFSTFAYFSSLSVLNKTGSLTKI